MRFESIGQQGIHAPVTAGHDSSGSCEILHDVVATLTAPAPPNGDLALGPPSEAAAAKRADRSVIAVCGDLHNLGDLALLLQNLDEDRGRRMLVRQWSPVPAGVLRQVALAGGTMLNGRSLIGCLATARRSDMVIGGGQIVRQNTSLRSLIYLALTAAVVHWSGGEITTRGLGISPTRGLRKWLWRSVLNRARRINARDRASYSRASDLCPGKRVYLTADMVFRRDVAAPPSVLTCAAPVVVAICEDASEDRAVAENGLLKLLEEARRRWPDAPLVGAVHDLRLNADAKPLARLRTQGLDIQCFRTSDLSQLLELYRHAAIVFTNRLHAGIFASLQERPVVVLDDGNDKLAVLHEKLSGALCKTAGDGWDDAARIIDKALAPSLEERRNQLAALRGKAERNLLQGGETALFNVKYSPNLGDGIIAECLESALSRSTPRIECRSIDLAGRQGFDARSGTGRRLLLQAMERLPVRIRQTALPAFISAMVRFYLRPRWKEAIDTCDSAVIGGGNLLADADQNFPIKLSSVLRLCGERRIPVAISHVGVTPNWSGEGRSRFENALSAVRLVDVSVRDSRSAASYRREFPRSDHKPRVALDPGLLCCETYGAPERSAALGRKRVGLCITHPLVLRLHGEGDVDGDLFKRWLRAVAERAVVKGLDLVVFTNGSPEDEAFAEEFLATLANPTQVAKPARFTSPGALARYIGGLDCVVAHRLHACIAAYSYRVPAIGFSWDRKLDSFFGLVGRSHYVVDWRETGPAQLVALIERALSDPPKAPQHAEILEECRSGIADLASALTVAKQAA